MLRICFAFNALACLGAFSLLMMNYKLQLTQGIGPEDLPVYVSLSSEAVKFTFSFCVALSIPDILHMLIYSVIHNKSHASKELYVLILVLIALKLPHIIITALIWLSSEYYIAVQTLIYCTIMLTYTSGLVLLNLYGPEIWRWVFITPSIILMCTALVVANIQPFFCPCFFVQFEITYSILAVSAICIDAVLCLRWCYHLFSKMKGSILTQHDIMCTINLALWVCLLLGMFLIGLVENTSWLYHSPSYYITWASIYSTYVVFIVVFNREQLVQEILASMTSREALMKQKVVGYFSHELRGPLNAVLMALQVLRLDNIGQQEKADLLNDVENSCTMATDILEDLVMYERLEAGEVSLTTSTLAIIPFLKTKLDKFLRLAQKRGIRFNAHFSDNCLNSITVRADVSKLKQIIRNVLYSALDSAGDNGVVSTIVDIDRGKSISMTISNSGSPLSKEQVESMFYEDKINFTAGVLEMDKSGGLNLLIAHRLASLHKASLGFSSDGGNAIIVTFPIELVSQRQSVVPQGASSPTHNGFESANAIHPTSAQGHAIADRRMSLSVGRVRAAPRDRRRSSVISSESRNSNAVLPFHPSRNNSVHITNDVDIHEPLETDNNHVSSAAEVGDNRDSYGRVLVVDDVLLNRKMLIRLLDGHCSESVEAINGQEAVNQMRTALENGPSFDLVVMDYQMPVMDGPSAAKAMREMGYKGPIIGVTGNVMEKDVETFISKGADKGLLKPLYFSILQEAVSAYWNAREAAADDLGGDIP